MKRCLSILLVLILLITLVPAAAFAEETEPGLKTSDELKATIKKYEGCVLYAYKAHPSEEHWTIGYGHYGPDVSQDMVITQEQADAFFEEDIVQFEDAVNRWNVKYSLELTQNEFDAMVSLTYNFGTSWVEYYGSSWRLARYVQAGFKDANGVPLPELELADAFGVLCSAGGDILPGLIRRRINEVEIFLYNDYDMANTDFVYTILDANGGALTGGNRVVIYDKDEPYGALPSAIKNGYVLTGWIDKSTGDAITAETAADESRTLQAVWTVGTAPTLYKLTVSGGEGSGNYPAGAKVKLTPASDEGKELDHWSVVGATVTKESDGSYYITMPSADVTVHAVWKGSCEMGDDCLTKAFTDVPISFWAHDDIDAVVDAGLFNGTSGTTFSPDVVMTRGMIITVLYRLEGSPDVSGYENPFKDMSEADYCYAAVLWGSHMRISNGFEDETFRHADELTREQLVTLLHRYSNHKGYNTEQYADLGGYTDAHSITPYARESMSWAIGSGIINGTGGTTLSPLAGAQRAQVAAIFHRFTGQMI